MFGARPRAARLAVVGGLATVSVGTLCLLVFFFKWRRGARRRRALKDQPTTSTAVQCDSLLDPALSSVCRAIEDVINIDTNDQDVLASIDLFVDAGRALLESWRSRHSPTPSRAANRQRLALISSSRAGATGDAASNQDSAVDLLADFDVGAAASSSRRNERDFDLQSNASSDISFLSAVEELEEYDRILLERQQLAESYDNALKLAEDKTTCSIPCRVLRTEQVGCSCDEEFLAKLLLIRQGFELYFSDPTKQSEFSALGREIFSEILRESDGNVAGFVTAFDEIIRFCHDPANLSQIKEELAVRQVSCLGFYDVVLDFVLMDALDELAETPPSVRSALSSPWLPESLKRGALSAAVATAIRAKRSRMKYSDGFMSRYYCLSDNLSLPLAWSILGPACPLQEKIASFHEMVMKYLQEIFSSDHVSFASPKETANTLGTVTDRYIPRVCLIFGVDRETVLNCT